MIGILELWLPILLAAVFVFIVSSVLHMLIPIHRGDYQKLPDEDAARAALRAQGLQPGAYLFPCAGSMKDMGTPEMLAKYEEGPVGFMTVVPSGAPAMGKSLAQWFLLSIVISLFTGYVGMLGLDRGAAYGTVFRLTATVALLGYAVSYVSDSIWKGVPWKVAGKFVFDGILYALVTAGTFGWLWPE